MSDLSGRHLETIHTLLHPTFQLAVSQSERSTAMDESKKKLSNFIFTSVIQNQNFSPSSYTSSVALHTSV